MQKTKIEDRDSEGRPGHRHSIHERRVGSDVSGTGDMRLYRRARADDSKVGCEARTGTRTSGSFLRRIAKIADLAWTSNAEKCDGINNP